MLTRASDLVGSYHRKNADLPGLHLEDLRQSVQDGLPGPGLFDLMVEHLGGRGIIQQGTILAEESFAPALSDDIRAAAEKIEQTLRWEPLSPPGRAELVTGSSSQRALSFLIRGGIVTELTDKVVILTQTYDQACERILDLLQSEGQATASDLRQHLATSRRVIMPLLERMDAEGKTRRNGDYRSAVS